jgi:hypothetical protein
MEDMVLVILPAHQSAEFTHLHRLNIWMPKKLAHQIPTKPSKQQGQD